MKSHGKMYGCREEGRTGQREKLSCGTPAKDDHASPTTVSKMGESFRAVSSPSELSPWMQGGEKPKTSKWVQGQLGSLYWVQRGPRTSSPADGKATRSRSVLFSRKVRGFRVETLSKQEITVLSLLLYLEVMRR